MTDAIKETIRDSAVARWTALAITSFTMLCGYLFTEIISPLKPLLERAITDGGLGWDSTAFGVVTGAYAIFNVFLFMLVISGFILDKKGIRFSLIASASIMLIGATIKYIAFISRFAPDAAIFGIPTQIFWAGFGFGIFGVGVEFAGITVSKVVVKWFKGRQMALAMGLQVACARLGTFAAMFFSAAIAEKFGVSVPVLLGVILLAIGLVSFIVYLFMDLKLDKQTHEAMQHEDAFHIKDIGTILGNKGFWYIALLCVLFYSAVFPFYKYGADLMVNKFSLAPKWAGAVPSLVPFGTLLLTPLFGNIYDRKGKGASIMIIGAVMLFVVHIILWFPGLTSVAIATVAIIILGVAFSLVPSAMWPSVPKIIPEHLLGTAFALIFWIQNIGLGGVPLLLGIVLDKSNPGVAAAKQAGESVVYNYSTTMFVFVILSGLAIFVSLLLKGEDRKKGYGLELPNIK